jgi:hypothetical protein
MESLKTPRTPGRSRFSKALPAPPPFESFAEPRNTVPEPLPPPPKLAAISKPPNSPLPRLPLKAGMPPMTIPRRPVASPPPVAAAQPSPVGSISSLLSAYSHTSGESILRSSEGTTSTKTSYIASSPEDGGLGSEFKRLEALTPLSPFSIESNSSRHMELQRKPSEEAGKPPPPAKDEKIPIMTRLPVGMAPSSANPSLNSALPQPQIWRRRSLKSEKPVAVPELQLAGSHGSTAATQAPPAKSNTLEPPTALYSGPNSPAGSTRSPSELARSPGGLPGRNIRPSPSREPMLVATPKIGETMSKLEAKIDTRPGRLGAEGITKTTSVSPIDRPRTANPEPPIRRLPTPEYDQHDIKSPLVQTIVSPVSPASSPELPAKESEPKPIQRKALVGRDIRPVKSTPSLKPQAQAAPELPALQSSPGPVDAATDRSPVAPQQPPAEQASFPARTTSRFAEQPRVVLRRQPAEAMVTQASAPAAVSRAVAPGPVAEDSKKQTPPPPPQLALDTSDAAIAGPEAPVTVDRGADFDERAAYFPVSFPNPAPEGTVFAAPPLRPKNFNCMQRHRSMYRDRNSHCPLSCQTCERQDAEVRWKCKWCYLRICGSCMDLLSESGRDLDVLLERLQHMIPEVEEEVDEEAIINDLLESSAMAPPTATVPPTLAEPAAPPPAAHAVVQEA